MQNNYKVCFIGDIYAGPGRTAVKKVLPGLIEKEDIDFTFANVENLAGGAGVTRTTLKKMMDAGIDCFTSGNHIWRRKDIYNLFENNYPVLRPANYPEDVPGREYLTFKKNGMKIAVFNLLGRTFLENVVDCPFKKGEIIYDRVKNSVDLILCDFHAETTSEKMAMGWHLDGKVDAVLGTHTHIPTSDERILDEDTAYITDVGMTGSFDSVIGVKKEIIVQRFLTGLPERFKSAKRNQWFNAVIIEFENKKAKSISRYQKRKVELDD
ncbi:MAG: TIGR00282 family metallophosphoesterase [Candidatus Mcinerneyibacterium aminivorans]|uniref:TIGR00282 family metallophosphoesterase n=1 Tax=Candidatus Mcinerneyibacterium aminivorans TaxID=2703815 RepID=A0A5D0MKI0_9BACT|nr:MAG: TIGR00282 family metallophosphoesterase [Candidatus Mcinerneyibacterium aminivorans]